APARGAPAAGARPRRARGLPPPDPAGAGAGRRRAASLPPVPPPLDSATFRRGPGDVLLHLLPVRLLPVRPRARQASRRPALLPRPDRSLRLRTGPYRALSRLPRARRAAGRTAVAWLSLSLHGLLAGGKGGVRCGRLRGPRARWAAAATR